MSSQRGIPVLIRGERPGALRLENGAYDAVDRGIMEADVTRHLRGELPALLSIPIMQSGLVHFACMDCDRHGEGDVAIDHKAVALKISETLTATHHLQVEVAKERPHLAVLQGAGWLRCGNGPATRGKVHARIRDRRDDRNFPETGSVEGRTTGFRHQFTLFLGGADRVRRGWRTAGFRSVHCAGTLACGIWV